MFLVIKEKHNKIRGAQFSSITVTLFSDHNSCCMERQGEGAVTDTHIVSYTDSGNENW